MANPEIEKLAALCAGARADLARAGRALHDDVGPLLSAAGFKLQLLRMDQPDALSPVNEVLELLEQAFERIRALSQQLNTSPVYRGGFRNAVIQLAEAPDVNVAYTATARVVGEPAAILFETLAAAVEASRKAGATAIHIGVTGARAIRIRVKDNGRWAGRAGALSIARLLASHGGIKLEISTKQSKLVLIRYADRRAAGR